MSCVVGLVDGERVWLGGDSAAFTEDVVVSYTSPKVFRKGKMIMGCVESFRMRDIIEHYFTAPRCTKLVAEETYVAAVVESLRACFQQHGYDLEAQVDDGRPHMAESGAVLFGFRGGVVSVGVRPSTRTPTSRIRARCSPSASYNPPAVS